MNIWGLVFGAGTLVALCVGAGIAVGILFGGRLAERDFCDDPTSGRYIPDEAVRAEVCG